MKIEKIPCTGRYERRGDTRIEDGRYSSTHPDAQVSAERRAQLGDEVLDLLVSTGNSNQSTMLFYGPLATGGTTVDPTDADASFEGMHYGGAHSAGDQNGDGYDDLLVGAPGFGSDKGILALMLGAASPASSGSFWGLTQMYVTGNVTSEAAGSTGALVDLDGDGASDLVVATPGYDGAAGGDQGRLTLFLGPLESYSGTYAASDGTVTVIGEDGGDYFGGASCLLPDFNGDGGADLAVSAPYSDGGAANGGRVYLVPSF